MRVVYLPGKLLDQDFQKVGEVKRIPGGAISRLFIVQARKTNIPSKQPCLTGFHCQLTANKTGIFGVFWGRIRKNGKSLYRYDFRRPFMLYVKAQGCPWVTPHVMRHTFASLLVSAGESIYKVAVWLGDDVTTVQRHYGHLTPDDHGIEKAFSLRSQAS